MIAEADERVMKFWKGPVRLAIDGMDERCSEISLQLD